MDWATPSSLVGMKALLLPALLALALLAGCGGSEGGDATMTQEEFVGAANEICRDVRGDAEALQAKVAAEMKENPDQTRQIFLESLKQEAIPLIRGMFDEISALDPPPELEADVNKLTSEAYAGLDEQEAHPIDALRENLRGETPFGGATEAAVALGLDDCAF